MTDICSELNVEPMSQKIILDYFVYAEHSFIEESINELKEWDGYKILKSQQDEYVDAPHHIEIHKAKNGILMRYGTFTETLEVLSRLGICDPPIPRNSHRAVLFSYCANLWSRCSSNERVIYHERISDHIETKEITNRNDSIGHYGMSFDMFDRWGIESKTIGITI